MGWKKYYVEGLNQTFRKAKTARAAAQRSANITGENHRIWIETAATGTMQVAIISPDKQTPDKQNPSESVEDVYPAETRRNPSQMKSIVGEDYEVVARRRAKLQDGKIGWTGVYRAAYSTDKTVVGYGQDFIMVPSAYQEGSAGGSGERRYSKFITSEEIRMRSNPSKSNPGRKLRGGGRAISLKNFTGRVIKKGNQVFIEGRGKRG